jgi:hypothetical protein
MTNMNLTTLAHGEPWMTPQEHDLNREFIRATIDYLASRNVPESPLITLRVNDVIVTWLLARRLETALTPPEDGTTPCPTLAQAGAIGKCRDRLRRALKELEACCPRNTGPNGPGLTDRMGAIINPDTTKNTPKESGSGVPPVIAPEPGASTPRESGTGVPPVIPPDPGTTPKESGTGVPPVISSDPSSTRKESGTGVPPVMVSDPATTPKESGKGVPPVIVSDPGNTPKERGTGVPPVMVSDPATTPEERGTGIPPVIVSDPGTTRKERGTGVPPVIASNPDARDPTTRPRLRNPPETNPDNDSGMLLTWTEHEREPHGWRTWW